MQINNLPLVSIVTIFLNAERFIQEAIESAISQTYQNWELLLVDDGSTDGSTAIARHYANQYPDKISYLDHDNHQNHGMSASRNLGIERASGKYVGFLDADDLWLPHKLEQQVAIMEAHPEAAMTYGHMQIWYSWTGKPDDLRDDRFFELGVPPNTLVQPPQLLINVLNTYFQEPGTSNVLIRSDVFQKFGRFEPTFRGWGEDKVFFSRIQLHAPIFVSGEFWLKYRQHLESSCHQLEQDRWLMSDAVQNFLSWLENYLLDQGMQNTNVWRVLQVAKARPRYRHRHRIIYRIWIGILDGLMAQGRRILPVNLRRWLWVNFVSKIYG